MFSIGSQTTFRNLWDPPFSTAKERRTVFLSVGFSAHPMKLAILNTNSLHGGGAAITCIITH